METRENSTVFVLSFVTHNGSVSFTPDALIDVGAFTTEAAAWDHARILCRRVGLRGTLVESEYKVLEIPLDNPTTF